jgi:predicted nucleic acid-binding protein
MIILDTNVLSELTRPHPDKTVVKWLETEALPNAWITSISEAEMRYGILRMPEGHRKRELHAAVVEIFYNEFLDRILPFDSSAAECFAEIRLQRWSIGRSTSTEDTIIAAITKAHNGTLATRNVKVFNNCGIDIINPFS